MHSKGHVDLFQKLLDNVSKEVALNSEVHFVAADKYFASLALDSESQDTLVLGEKVIEIPQSHQKVTAHSSAKLCTVLFHSEHALNSEQSNDSGDEESLLERAAKMCGKRVTSDGSPEQTGCTIVQYGVGNFSYANVGSNTLMLFEFDESTKSLTRTVISGRNIGDPKELERVEATMVYRAEKLCTNVTIILKSDPTKILKLTSADAIALYTKFKEKGVLKNEMSSGDFKAYQEDGCYHLKVRGNSFWMSNNWLEKLSKIAESADLTLCYESKVLGNTHSTSLLEENRATSPQFDSGALKIGGPGKRLFCLVLGSQLLALSSHSDSSYSTILQRCLIGKLGNDSIAKILKLHAQKAEKCFNNLELSPQLLFSELTNCPGAVLGIFYGVQPYGFGPACARVFQESYNAMHKEEQEKRDAKAFAEELKKQHPTVKIEVDGIDGVFTAIGDPSTSSSSTVAASTTALPSLVRQEVSLAKVDSFVDLGALASLEPGNAKTYNER